MIVDHQIREFGTSPLWKVISRVKIGILSKKILADKIVFANEMCHSLHN